MNSMEDSNLMAEMYDPIYQDRDDISFYLELARRYAPRRILECGCGTGRVTVPLALQGQRVDGIDLSEERLELLESKLGLLAPEVRERVTWRRADMRDVRLAERYDLVIMPFRTFQHLLTVTDQMLALANLKRHLLPGGRVLIDIFNPSIPRLAEERVSPWLEAEFSRPDGSQCRFFQRILRRDFHAQTQDAEEIFEISLPATSEVRTLRYQYTTRFTFRWELEHLLIRCGFEVETTWGGFDFAPVGATYPGETLMLARIV